MIHNSQFIPTHILLFEGMKGNVIENEENYLKIIYIFVEIGSRVKM